VYTSIIYSLLYIPLRARFSRKAICNRCGGIGDADRGSRCYIVYDHKDVTNFSSLPPSFGSSHADGMPRLCVSFSLRKTAPGFPPSVPLPLSLSPPLTLSLSLPLSPSPPLSFSPSHRLSFSPSPPLSFYPTHPSASENRLI